MSATGGQVRASGPYAEHGGQTWAIVSAHKPQVRLVAPEGARPPGFDDLASGRWTRLVPRGDVARIVRVTTRARWRGNDVEVVQVRDGRCRVQGWTYPPPAEPEVGTPENTYWEAWVDATELDAVVEQVDEVPL